MRGHRLLLAMPVLSLCAMGAWGAKCPGDMSKVISGPVDPSKAVACDQGSTSYVPVMKGDGSWGYRAFTCLPSEPECAEKIRAQQAFKDRGKTDPFFKDMPSAEKAQGLPKGFHAGMGSFKLDPKVQLKDAKPFTTTDAGGNKVIYVPTLDKKTGSVIMRKADSGPHAHELAAGFMKERDRYVKDRLDGKRVPEAGAGEPRRLAPGALGKSPQPSVAGEALPRARSGPRQPRPEYKGQMPVKKPQGPIVGAVPTPRVDPRKPAPAPAKADAPSNAAQAAPQPAKPKSFFEAIGSFFSGIGKAISGFFGKLFGGQPAAQPAGQPAAQSASQPALGSAPKRVKTAPIRPAQMPTQPLPAPLPQ